MGAKRIIAYAFATVIAAAFLFQTEVRLLEEITVESQVGVHHSNDSEWEWENFSLPIKNATSTNSSSVVPTIIIYTSGELGNHMMHLAHAYSIAWLAERKYGMQTKMIIHDQITRGRVNAKSYSVKKIIAKCFPNLQSLYDGPRANTLPEYRIRMDQQRRWGLVNHTILQHINNGITSLRDVEVTIDHLRLLMDSDNIPEIEANSSITLPLIESTAMDNFELIHWFSRELRQLFTFNETACCMTVPDPNETVLHFRNFGTEMPKRGISLGFEELSPRKISEDLLGNLTGGDQVAITSRYINDAVDNIVVALRARDIQVRVVTNQSAEEDFCFLKMAKKELVGMAKSTYVRWAGILGDANLVRMYIVDSPVTRAKGHTLQVPFNLTNNLNLSRIRFELIKSEEMDKIDNG